MLPLVENLYVQFGLWSGFAVLLICFAYQIGQTVRQQWQQQQGIVDLINQQLPQTQCGQCGHAGCLPYARAISQGEAINKCPPGGESTIRRLAGLLNELNEPLNPAHGAHQPPGLALIRESECIGCTKCIQACPVDAILGAPKLMHTVIASECTGCDLCVDPCPVDCIDMVTQPAPAPVWSRSC